MKEGSPSRCADGTESESFENDSDPAVRNCIAHVWDLESVRIDVFSSDPCSFERAALRTGGRPGVDGRAAICNPPATISVLEIRANVHAISIHPIHHPGPIIRVWLTLDHPVYHMRFLQTIVNHRRECVSSRPSPTIAKSSAFRLLHAKTTPEGTSEADRDHLATELTMAPLAS